MATSNDTLRDMIRDYWEVRGYTVALRWEQGDRTSVGGWRSDMVGGLPQGYRATKGAKMVEA